MVVSCVSAPSPPCRGGVAEVSLARVSRGERVRGAEAAAVSTMERAYSVSLRLFVGEEEALLDERCLREVGLPVCGQRRGRGDMGLLELADWL